MILLRLLLWRVSSKSEVRIRSFVRPEEKKLPFSPCLLMLPPCTVWRRKNHPDTYVHINEIYSNSYVLVFHKMYLKHLNLDRRIRVQTAVRRCFQWHNRRARGDDVRGGKKTSPVNHRSVCATRYALATSISFPVAVSPLFFPKKLKQRHLRDILRVWEGGGRDNIIN